MPESVANPTMCSRLMLSRTGISARRGSLRRPRTAISGRSTAPETMERTATIHSGVRLSRIIFWTGQTTPQMTTTTSSSRRPCL